MIGKLLIANRGEIACRVIATARRMGIATVAVHSDADTAARHVAMADEAVRIGPPPATESYLRGDAIVAAALATGAGAIHPGYGFLSENASFVDQVEAAGLVFVGPPADAIRAMGLKDAAKRLMDGAGVPVVPGYHGEDQDDRRLADEAQSVGYPILIKARAGGGGKGMRLVKTARDFPDALHAARREAAAAFGDGAVLVEKFVSQPRHVEIQVFADRHGNVVHLFERDCSLQRRHQKVLEEAPAPGMTEEVRATMGAAAVEAARAIGYVGAGTVEFIADGREGLRPDGFWFMEMNTRLQVEHPVTEAITGLDLVELQLRIADGERLPFAQHDLRPHGHAVEVRLYAEDATRGFLPATGRLATLAFQPAESFRPGPVRVDAGAGEGDEIAPWYDPMIAKVIAHGPDREAAFARLGAALSRTRIAGTVTNLSFLRALVGHEGVRAGQVDTGLIERDLEALAAPPAPSVHAQALLALAAAGMLVRGDPAAPWTALAGFRLWEPAVTTVRMEIRKSASEIRIAQRGPGSFEVGDIGAVAVSPIGDGWAVTVGDRRVRLHLARDGDRITAFDDHGAHEVRVIDPLVAGAEEHAGGDSLTAPMPGLVKLLAVAPGDAIRRGQTLVVLEAMKMEHALTAPRDGVVEEVRVAEGRQVGDGDVLLILAEDGGTNA